MAICFCWMSSGSFARAVDQRPCTLYLYELEFLTSWPMRSKEERPKKKGAEAASPLKGRLKTAEHPFIQLFCSKELQGLPRYTS